MSLEQELSELNATMKVLVTVLQSGAGSLGTTAVASTEKPKADAKDKPKAEPKAVAWKDVMEKIKTLNTSKTDGHGRPAIEAMIAKFAKAGDKVPVLEALNKHAEILAYVNGVLDGSIKAEPAAEDDDLGLG